jgi:hypothetical protein
MTTGCGPEAGENCHKRITFYNNYDRDTYISLETDYPDTVAGQSLGEAFINSFDGIGKSMAIGGAIEVVTTIGVSYAQGINPWTGENNSIEYKSVGAKGTKVDMKKINDNYLKLKGFDAHGIKYEYLGDKALISRYNLYKTPSGQIIISDGKNVQIMTEYFIK